MSPFAKGHRFIRSGFLTSTVIVCMSVNSNAQTTSLSAAKDNTMFAENVQASNGAGTEFFVGLTGAHASFSKRRGLIYFDLSSIPGGSVVTSVTLTITCVKAPPAGSRAPNTIALHRSIASWGEGSSAGLGNGATATQGDATWACRFSNGLGACAQSWPTAGGDFVADTSSFVTVNDIREYVFPQSPKLLADIQRWVDTPSINFGWILRGDEITGYSTRAFGSRESPAKPTLIVTYHAAACTTSTWTGAVNSSWEEAGNWSCGRVPDSSTNVVIGSGLVVVSSDATVKSLSLSSGASLTVNPSYHLVILQME